jgi:hypothetical protein
MERTPWLLEKIADRVCYASCDDVPYLFLFYFAVVAHHQSTEIRNNRA